MKIILLQDVANLGSEGDIVTVKNGYGRNFLIPKGVGRLATKGTVKARQEEMRQQVRKRAQIKEDAQAFVNELAKVEVVIEAKVGEENRIFGTVTPQQVAVKLALQGFNIARRDITVNEEIRMIGVYSASVKLHADVVGQLKICVVPEGGADVPVEPEPDTEPAAASDEA